jgi:DNA modification methylase
MAAKPDLGHIAPDLRGSVAAVSRLRIDESNSRDHPERSIAAIRGSLERFGQQKPIVLGKGNLVRAGNGTVLAARELGWTHVAVTRSNLRGRELDAYAVADNRTAEFAEWNRERLAALIAELPEDAIAATGWTPPDLEALLNPDTDDPDEDGSPEPLDDAVTREGDLWLLGRHRLLCGDSTLPETYARLMEGKAARLCATDPPYLVDYTGKRAGDRGKDWSDTYREIDIEDADAFFFDLFSCVLGVLAPYSAIYCWHAHKRHPDIARVWEALDILDHQQIVWVKPAALFGSVFWHFRHEPCMMGWKRRSKPTHDGRHDFNSVWEVPGMPGLEELSREQLLALIETHSSVWYIDWCGKARPIDNEHPTEKPVEIFARPMRKHTRRGDIVLEPFSGSGSQLSAAEQLGRRCRAIEICPTFVDVGVRRWQRLTGQDAILEGDGRTWAELAKERGVAIEE